MNGTVGPYFTVKTREGVKAPWYIVPFDKKGRCKAPQTRAHLIDALDNGDFTHVYLFSHGWNNDWGAASERYKHFVGEFARMRKERDLDIADPYRPLLIGIIWPSTSLVLPWESAPKIAAAGGDDSTEHDLLAADANMILSDFADDLPDDKVERFYELAARDKLDTDEATEFAELLAPLMADDGDSLDAAELADAWRAGAALAPKSPSGGGDAADDGDFGTAAPVSGGPQVAGFFDALDPRHALRMASVWRMKDRAGRVGANGVHDLVRDALAATDASFHLVGHSFGAKVVLSALAAGPLSRNVESLLLLQPAVSYRCFSGDVDGDGTPGGYHDVPKRVDQPIVSTYSTNDYPLTKVFHLAVRRKSDLGEQQIAAAPSRYAALGGFGPGGLGDRKRVIGIKNVFEAYDDLDRADIDVLGLESSAVIDSHGGISKPQTWWILYEQARRAP